MDKFVHDNFNAIADDYIKLANKITLSEKQNAKYTDNVNNIMKIWQEHKKSLTDDDVQNLRKAKAARDISNKIAIFNNTVKEGVLSDCKKMIGLCNMRLEMVRDGYTKIHQQAVASGLEKNIPKNVLALDFESKLPKMWSVKSNKHQKNNEDEYNDDEMIDSDLYLNV